TCPLMPSRMALTDYTTPTSVSFRYSPLMSAMTCSAGQRSTGSECRDDETGSCQMRHKGISGRARELDDAAHETGEMEAACAICEAVQRPTMRCVPVKTADQQAAVLLHRGRERLVRQRTGLVNALRGHLAEFGAGRTHDRDEGD